MLEQNSDRLIFTADFSNKQQEIALKEIKAFTQKRILSQFGIPETHSRNRLITFEEKNFLEKVVFEKVVDKLAEIGINDCKSILPIFTQIIILEYFNLNQELVGGFVPEFGQNLIIEPPSGMKLTDPRAQIIFFHEIGHFVTPQVIGYCPTLDSWQQKYGMVAWGFDRMIRTRYSSPIYLGIYEESLAVIFSLFCKDGYLKAPVATYYSFETAFMTAFLKELARRTSTTPLDAFKRLFKAKIERDFLFQKELVDVFGRNCIKFLNSVRASGGIEVSLTMASRSGGFYDKYLRLQETMGCSGVLEFPGLSGYIKIQPRRGNVKRYIKK